MGPYRTTCGNYLTPWCPIGLLSHPMMPYAPPPPRGTFRPHGGPHGAAWGTCPTQWNPTGPHGNLSQPMVPHGALIPPYGGAPSGTYPTPWNPMRPRWAHWSCPTPWNPMCPMGYLFHPMGPHGVLVRPDGAPWDTYPIPWRPMRYLSPPCAPWASMGYLSDSMGPQLTLWWTPWRPMNPHGVLIPPHRRPHGAPWVTYTTPWDLMVPHGAPWGTYSTPLTPMVPHEVLIRPHGAPWDTHPAPWGPMVPQGALIQLHGAPWGTYSIPWETPWNPMYTIGHLSHLKMSQVSGLAGYLADPMVPHGAPRGTYPTPSCPMAPHWVPIGLHRIGTAWAPWSTYLTPWNPMGSHGAP